MWKILNYVINRMKQKHIKNNIIQENGLTVKDSQVETGFANTSPILDQILQERSRLCQNL